MKKVLLTIMFSLFIIFTIKAGEVSIKVNGYTLKGTLEVPNTGKTVDVVLIISGSGPTDRNGNSRLLPGKNNSLKMLADSLYANGIASLRYDKRGIGESSKLKETDVRFDMYVNDAVHWIEFLRKNKRFSKIIIAGHSEGSLIGMIAADREHADKFISLCGAGRPAYTVIEEQLKKSKLPEPLMKECNSIIDSLRHGTTVNKVDRPLTRLFRPSVQPYLISWFKYDPAKEIARLKIPVLIIEGTTDIQIDVKDAKRLAKANNNGKLKIINNMNHILKNVPTLDRRKNYKSYSNPDLPLPEELCKNIIKFIKQG